MQLVCVCVCVCVHTHHHQYLCMCVCTRMHARILICFHYYVDHLQMVVNFKVGLPIFFCTFLYLNPLFLNLFSFSFCGIEKLEFLSFMGVYLGANIPVPMEGG